MTISEDVQDGLAAPLFSYHAMVSSAYDAETMSRSPSPSISATCTSRAASAVVAILAEVHDGSAAPSFSYQAMVSSSDDAETMSRSPSPSISATCTARAEFALVAISAEVHDGSAAPSFSYQAMVSSPNDAETMSRSPSSSISATYTSFAPCALVAMSAAVHDGSAAPSFSYHAMVLSSNNAETISRSPSSSMSATCRARASTEVAISVAVHEPEPSFSYHVILPSCPSELSVFDAETISKSPSPSKSATWTPNGPSAEVEISVAFHDGLGIVKEEGVEPSLIELPPPRIDIPALLPF